MIEEEQKTVSPKEEETWDIRVCLKLQLGSRKEKKKKTMGAVNHTLHKNDDVANKAPTK
jgi:hypothetical protein